MLFFDRSYSEIFTGFDQILSIIDAQRYKEGWCENFIFNQKVTSLYHKYFTKPSRKCVWESHRNVIDIQYCYSGSEIIYSSKNNDSSFISKLYDETIDKEIWTEKLISICSRTILTPGCFVLFACNELHKPQVSDSVNELIEKIVLKVPSSVFFN